MRASRVVSAAVWIVLVLVGPTAPALAAAPAQAAAPLSKQDQEWSQIDILIAEEKFTEASARIDALLAEAMRNHDEKNWTRALELAAEARVNQGGIEAEVDQLRTPPWPPSARSRTELNLVLAHSYLLYLNRYGYEIGKRQRIESSTRLPLKQWTQDQILAAARDAMSSAWAEREALGNEPVGSLADIAVPNNYPPDVRGTVRDAMTYLSVAFIANSEWWSPQESEEAKRLDVAPLLGPAATVRGGERSTTLHPVARGAAVLADLEAWHQSKGQRAAALEAFLERIALVHDSSSRLAEQKRVLGALATRLDADRSISWWSEGMAVSAMLRMQESDPAAMRDAHALAAAGEKAYPGTPGALNCKHITATIESPDYNVEAMENDRAHQRSISINHRNLPRLYFRAYRIDLAARIAAGQTFPARAETEKLIASQKPVVAWTEDLPATPDFGTHRTYATPPISEAGAYSVVVSTNESFSGDHNPLRQVDLVLGNLVLVQESLGRHLRLRTLSGATGAPVAGATIQLFTTGPSPKPVASLTTDARGAVTYTSSDSVAAVARQGSDLATSSVFLNGSWDGDQHVLFFTDRSIYRPGQTVFWKLVAFSTRNAKLQPQPEPQASIDVQMHDPNRQVVASAEVKTNAYATASGSFVIPTGRPLGSYALTAGRRGGTSIRVEEYKRPTFEVTLKEPAEEPRLNRPAVFRGDVRYYFGSPVTGGTVRWRVRRQPVYPTWWWLVRASSGAQEVASGTAQLTDGTFEAHFVPSAIEGLESEVSYEYRLTADVTDEGGETRSSERTFRVGTSTIEAAIESDDTFAEAGRPMSMRVLRADLDGEPRPGIGTWRLVALPLPGAAQLPADEPEELPKGSIFNTPGDALKPRWQRRRENFVFLRQLAEGAETAHGELTHDAAGRASFDLPPIPAGAYRLVYTTRDRYGSISSTQREFVVAGDAPLPFAAMLQAQRAKAMVGETVRVLLHSGFVGQEMELQITHGLKMEYRRFVSTATPQVIDLPVTDGDRGGIALRLVAVRDDQELVENSSIAVPWDNREARIEFQTFRDLVRPGAKETWRVKVTQKGPEGAEPAAAELLAYMYDRSLDVYTQAWIPHLMNYWPHDQPTSLHVGLGGHWAYWVRGGLLATVPPGADLHGDQLRMMIGMSFRGLGIRYRLDTDDFATVTAESPSLDERQFSTGAVLVPKVAQSFAEPQSTAGMLPPPSPPAPTGGASADSAPTLRSNFSETAFWQPHLLTNPDGTASIEFTVPDSVTSWNVWVHALTKDLRFGSEQRQTRSAKALMARPYLPRFLREGDRAELRVEINDTTDHGFDGTLRLEIQDAEQETSLLHDFGIDPSHATQRFHVDAGKSTSVTIPLTTPRRVGQANFKVVAEAGDTSDGEQRPLPLLPSRIHLTESKFMALHDRETKSVTFPDLQHPNDTSLINSDLVVTVDGQLFYSVLAAVPYLVRYPYECTEQTLNRFLSSAILSSMFSRYPAVSHVAEQLAKRSTQELPFDGPDANRQMALEETPWLLESRGEAGGGNLANNDPLIRVLDPRIARAERDSALEKLKKAQLADGSFPWWAGGPSSDYMTLYLLYGLAKAREFGVEVPKDMVARGWTYLAHRYTSDFKETLEKPDCKCRWEFLTFLTYLSTTYPDPSWMGDALPVSERRRILSVSFQHWKEQSTMLKSMLALALHRMGRPKDAELVIDAIMDGAKTTPEEGTFWQPDRESWIWYHDTIETHALALRTLSEIRPSDPRLAGLVQWLFLNKKLNHWKSTRATAEVVYSLAHYLSAHEELAVREAAKIQIGPETVDFVFEPDRYTGAKNQVVVAGERLDSERATVTVSKDTPGLLFASATWHYSTEKLPATGKGDLFSVERRFFRRAWKGKEAVLTPLAEGASLAPGDEVDVELVLRSRAAAEYVHLRDPRAAGFEPGAVLSGWRWTGGPPHYEEVRDSGTNFFFEWLPAGEYTFHYQVRASLAGTFRIGPATVESVYAPEFAAFSAGHEVTIQGLH
jgi:uncharacterized protein YfaS (alpha-2-macroglobulin family)